MLRAVDLCGGAVSVDTMGACAVIVAMFVPDAALACPVGCERLLPRRSCGLQWVGAGKNVHPHVTEERMKAQKHLYLSPRNRLRVDDLLTASPALHVAP